MSLPTREPTERQAQVWEAVTRLGGQTAAARELGLTQGAVRNALMGYMAARDMRGPMPGARMGGGRPRGYAKADFARLEERIAAQDRQLASLRDRLKASQPLPEDWSPLCMDPDELADWRAFNRTAGAGGRAQRPCDDCPMSFALEMFAARRCNGIPGQT